MSELDPLSPVAGFPAVVHFFAGQFNAAVEFLEERGSRLALDDPMYRWYASFFLVYAKRPEEALDVLEPVERTTASDAFSQCARFLRRVLLRGEPRFQQLMVRVKREWEDFED